MKISIAIATYNGEVYLNEQLNSILKQTIIPDEVVISDDNSNDNTLHILNNFKNNAPFEVRILQNKKRGFNTNFENALINTTGDIIFICDQDDVWLEHKIEKIVDQFNLYPELYLVIHDLEFCDSNLNPIGQTKIERFKNQKYLLNDYVTGMATAVRRVFLETCFPFPDSINYDSWIHICATIIERKKVIRDILALYRRHNENATKDSWINTPYKLKKKQVFFSTFKPIYIDDLMKRLLISKNLLEYLFTLKDKNDLAISNIDDIIFKHKQRIEGDTYRCNILKKDRFNRTIKAIYFYFKRGYNQYSGWKSLLLDVFAKVN